MDILNSTKTIKLSVDDVAIIATLVELISSYPNCPESRLAANNLLTKINAKEWELHGYPY